MPTSEDREELPRAREGMRHPLGDQERLHGRRDQVRAVMRDIAPVRQAAAALRLVACQPLVVDPAAHAIPGTQFTHREAVALCMAHELQSFLQRSTLPPWHRRPRCLEIRRAV